MNGFLPRTHIDVMRTQEATPASFGNHANLNSVFQDTNSDIWIVDNNGDAIKVDSSNQKNKSSTFIVTATTTLTSTQHKILVNNGATNITITFPDALLNLGREYVISRYSGSTGSITLQTTAGNTIQAYAGTTGATSSIGAHNTAGAGLNHQFTAFNIGGIGVWVRI